MTTTHPALALAEASFTMTPTSGPGGTTITLSSTQPCPPPPSGSFAGVVAQLADAYTMNSIDGAMMTANPDRSWSGSLQVETGTRNGGDVVYVACVSDSADDPVYAFSSETFVVTSPPGQADPVVRLAGPDRFETAIAISQDVFRSSGSAGAVVLSRADSYADALAGTPLAGWWGAPLLLTGRDQLTPRTRQEIERVLERGGIVHLLGGLAAIGQPVQDELRALGYEVVRYAGANRYDTAVRIASEGLEDPSTLLLATGTDFADGLIAGAAGCWANPVASDCGAVLLTNGTTMAAETAAYLAAHPTAERYAVGAPAAAADPQARALVGADPAATSVRVAETFFPGAPQVGVATATNFPDSLAGGTHMTFQGGPLLLSNPASLSTPVSGYLQSNKGIAIGFVYGGTVAVSDTTLGMVAASIT